MNRAGQIWTQEEYDQLREEFAKGMTASEMSEAHGRTPMAVVAKLQQMNLIILIGTRAYHRIEPDPWILVSMLQQNQRGES